MTTRPLRLALIVASTRQGRFGEAVGRWAACLARDRPEYAIDVIDLADLALPADLSGSADVRDFAERIGAADAFLIVTCEYNHGYPASLKLAVDSVREEWAAKPVGFVCYGGVAGGLRAVEQLRQIFAELHAVTMRDTVSFHFPHTRIAPDGRVDDPAIAESAETAARTLFDRLAWWGTALRDARSALPYAPVT
ncbi:NADPH-dependent FMN reductase [Streptomonospora salina]|uniref:NAD(P)H-dependent FMN reductase n=1 Tax=Streptomonospora salina TaxID=104205 RepID=A0A841EA60_9ACTN|nr:NAD(P)H-dependent oxidoreductase [Streptomonospora salina]MBB6000907.1 NAD(P)H-dependent FMN reductase [Streptomonospora salina]